jgi:DNA polymerase-3 subunit alpha
MVMDASRSSRVTEVSDHPLRGLEAALEAESDISVGELGNPEGHHEG